MSLHCVKVLDDDCRARYGRVIVTVKDTRSDYIQDVHSLQIYIYIYLVSSSEENCTLTKKPRAVCDDALVCLRV